MEGNLVNSQRRGIPLFIGGRGSQTRRDIRGPHRLTVKPLDFDYLV